MEPDLDEALDASEQCSAIRGYGGRQPHKAAEAAALDEVGQAAGIAPEALRQLWANHPDACAYLAHLTRHGPQTYGAAASDIRWGATRAWQAEARLRAAGLVRMGPLGEAIPVGATRDRHAKYEKTARNRH